MSEDTSPQRILLGIVLSAHGIRGDVHVKSFTDVLADIASYGPLTSADGSTTYKLKLIRETSKRLTVHIDGVDDRNAAEALRGTELYIERGQLPELDAATFYFEDLTGLSAIDATGAKIGTVISVQNHGASDILEIKSGDAASTMLVPFTEAFVPRVSLEDGTVTVNLPDEQDDEDRSEAH